MRDGDGDNKINNLSPRYAKTNIAEIARPENCTLTRKQQRRFIY